MPQVLIPSREDLFRAAQSGPELLREAQVYDPELAKRLQGTSLAGSKTLWGGALTLLLGYLSTRFALGWDKDFCALVASILALSVQSFFHWIDNFPMIAKAPEASAPLVGNKPQ